MERGLAFKVSIIALNIWYQSSINRAVPVILHPNYTPLDTQVQPFLEDYFWCRGQIPFSYKTLHRGSPQAVCCRNQRNIIVVFQNAPDMRLGFAFFNTKFSIFTGAFAQLPLTIQIWNSKIECGMVYAAPVWVSQRFMITGVMPGYAFCASWRLFCI